MLSHLLPAALLLSTATASCLHGTSHMPRRLNRRAEVEVSNFGYTGLQGPLNWHNLDPENSACNTGSRQSPINVDDTVTVATEAPAIEIANVEAAEFENLGSTLETIVNGTTTVGGVAFNLAQYHMHTPSEHRINEEYFPLEVHMVHEAADGSGGVVVLAVLFQLSEDGNTTDLLTATTANIAEVATPGSVTETAALNFEPLVSHLTTTPLLNYTGSLTTPPCTEGITFLITQEPLPINVATFNSIKSVIKFNSRFTQNSLNSPNLLDQAAVAQQQQESVAAEAAAPAEEAATKEEAATEDTVGHAAPPSKSESSNVTAEGQAPSAEQLTALRAMLHNVAAMIQDITG